MTYLDNEDFFAQHKASKFNFDVVPLEDLRRSGLSLSRTRSQNSQCERSNFESGEIVDRRDDDIDPNFSTEVSYMGDGAHDHYSSRKQPNISPGARQKHSHEILNTIKSVRDNLERLEEYVRKFELQEDVIPAIVLNYIDRDISVINYKVGQANGALVLPDMRD